MALYAELDEKADHLRRADDLKSKFLSNMSHEFRSPLNSILALSPSVSDEVDGPLIRNRPQQVRFIRKAAEDLYELVNDLLDLAKVEAGKVEVKPVEFEVSEFLWSFARYASAIIPESVGQPGIRTRRRFARPYFPMKGRFLRYCGISFECVEIHRARRSPGVRASLRRGPTGVSVADTGSASQRKTRRRSSRTSRRSRTPFKNA